MVSAAATTRWGVAVDSGVVVAGSGHTVTLTALDAYGNTTKSYAGTAHLTSSDAQVVAPTDAVFTAANNGRRTMPGSLVLKTAGSQSLTVADTAFPAINGSAAVTVTPGPFGSMSLTGVPASVTKGQIINATVGVLDAYGNPSTNYAGTLTFSSNDGGATLPSSSAMNGATKAYPVTLNTVGANRTVSVTDGTRSATVNNITVVSTGVANLVVSGLSNSTAGAANSVTVRAVDSTNATVISYVGTVHFTSSDAQGLLPANYTFVAGDAGQHTFSGGVTLKTAGTQSVTATDVSTAVTGTQSGITITAASANTLAVTGLSASVAGATQSVTVTAVDPYGNTATSYLGTVHFTSTDGAATLPLDTTFTAGNAGQRTFVNAVILRTSGTRAVTATDTATASITGTQGGLVISAGSATHLAVTNLTGGTAGVAKTVQVQAQDAYNNPASTYAGTVQFTSDDAVAGLPANYLFVAADAGTHLFNNGVTLKTAGTRSVTATDTGDASITGAQTGLVITAAAANNLAVTGPSSVTAGSSQTATVRVRDLYGNTVTTYTGRVHFTSADSVATLPGDYTFVAGDSGSHAFTGVILRTAGSRDIVATDTVTASITGSLSPITVTPAAASQLSVSGIGAGAAGSPRSATVTARDTYGNTATGYTGKVHFTSSDSIAGLPSDTTFLASDNGVRAFTNSVVLKTVGSQSVTATDTVTASITGSQGGISVTPGAATTLVVAGFATNPTAGAPGTLTVTAKDAYNNTATGYTGTVKITSSDPQAALPANHVYVAGDLGVASFNATLKTVGSQTLTATDTVTATITGAQGGIVVKAASASVLGVTGYGPNVVAGQMGSITVTAYDVYGNTATSYTGRVHTTSTDGGATTLPADYTFVAGDSGVHTFNNQVRLVTAGTRAITATDTVTASITGTLGGVVVSAGPASVLVLSGVAAAVTTNTWLTPAVTVRDAYGNTAVGYTGTVQFSSTDADAQLPTPYTFTAGDAGSRTFTTELQFNTVGTQSLTATDTVTGSLTVTQSGISVSQGYVMGAYEYVNCQITPNGKIKCWGANNNGALGLGDTTARGSSLAQMGTNLPTIQVGTGRTVKATGGSLYHTCAILDNNALKCWGNNASGQLGLGDTASRGDAAGEMGDTLPAVNLGTGRTVRAYGAGRSFACAVLDNGAVKCWGDGNTGELGNGSTASVGGAAGQMGDSLVAVNLGTGRTGLTVNGGYLGTCALMDNHQVKCWGNNASGQLGVGDTTTRGNTAASMGNALPAASLGTGRSARQVVRTWTHSCAVLDTWQVKCWGENTVGELGVGDTANRGDGAGEMGDNLPAVNLGTGRSARQLEAGSYGTTCAVLDNGQVKCWGYNASGQCGLGDTTNRGTTAASMGDGLPAVNLGTGRTAKQVSIGTYHVCVLLDNDTIKCWGQNGSYQLGLGDSTTRGTTAASMGDNLPAVSL